MAAPHRFSLSEDYEACILSSIISVLGVYDSILKSVLEFKKGERDIRRLNIGKNIAKALSLCFQDSGYRMSTEMCLTSTILTYIDIIQTEIEKDFYKALRKVFNALQVSEVDDTIELVKVMRNIGGNFYLLLDRAGISEKKIIIEGITLYQLFEEFSKYDPLFECFSRVQKVIDTIKLAEKIYNEYKNINNSLSRLFMEMVRDKAPISSSKISEIFRIDSDYRKKGICLTYVMPYIAYASLYLVKH